RPVPHPIDAGVDQLVARNAHLVDVQAALGGEGHPGTVTGEGRRDAGGMDRRLVAGGEVDDDHRTDRVHVIGDGADHFGAVGGHVEAVQLPDRGSDLSGAVGVDGVDVGAV